MRKGRMTNRGGHGAGVVPSTLTVVVFAAVVAWLFVTVACSFEGEDSESWILTRVYQIGDTGPAGGVIFYDAGDRSNGWRYLEAGPVDLVANTFWNTNITTLAGTGTEVGTGESNTELIVTTLGGTSDFAPQQCWNYEYNGSGDWFLPSRDELVELYNQQSLVPGLVSVYYWSSTETSSANVTIFDFTAPTVVDVPQPKDNVPPADIGVRPVRRF